MNIGTLFTNIGNSALLNNTDPINVSHPKSNQLPASFVPGRNIIFLTAAAMVAYKHNIKDIVTGVCGTDFSGYADCRDNTIKSLQVTLSLALDKEITIHTPLMWLTKAKTVLMAHDLGTDCWDALSLSHTCYEGKRPPCQKCPACRLRAKGFEEAGYEDPILP
jgi:7-cyano-7-deazaguanine synthase